MINYLATQKNWQNAFSDTITSFAELAQALDLPIDSFDSQVGQFPLKVPRRFVQKMGKGDIHDPLLKQVLPTFQETVQVTGFVTDPLDEQHANPVKGIIHKYASRVLIPVTGACVVNCRYCFRQHFDYHENLPTQNDWQAISAYITAHPAVNEVILSGGDPLNVTNRRLFAWLDTLEAIPQLTTIRLHTRLPLVIPARLDEALLDRLSQSRCQIVMVIHCNHANEIDALTAEYLQRTRAAGVTLLNQAVLLKGINDSVTVQTALSQRLFAAGVLPYYLHVLDKVDGAAHFDSDERAAIQLYWALLAALPGYLVPKLVRELPNKPFKVPIDIYNEP